MLDLLVKPSHRTLGLRRVTLATFTGVTLQEIVPDMFIFPFLFMVTSSIRLEFGHDTYLFIS